MLTQTIRLLARAAMVAAAVAAPARAADATEGLIVGAASRAPIAGRAPAAQVPAPGAAAQTPRPLPPGVVAIAPCSGAELEAPVALPPPGSPPFIWMVDLCFARQGDEAAVDTDTYQYYMKLEWSRPSEGRFIPWDEAAQQRALSDFHTLMESTPFLDDLVISYTEHRFAEGQVGVIVTYDMLERQRVRVVQFDGTTAIDRTQIDEQLQAQDAQIRLDSFLDERLVRRVENVLRLMMAEKGFTGATVTHQVTPVAGARQVNVRFQIDEGPKIRIRSVTFTGNEAFSARTLRRRIKENRPGGMLGWLMGGGTYKEGAFADDAALIEEHYHNHGYVQARVGEPRLEVIEDSRDGRTRWIDLQIPVEEGPRYRLGSLEFEGNKLVTTPSLEALYKLVPGEWFSRKNLVEGNQRAQEIYGVFGYMEFTPFPDMKFSDQSAALADALHARVPPALLAPVRAPTGARPAEDDPTVDLVVRIEEGPQYVVNRITFTGNTTTRDHVIRRELRLQEGRVFDTEALKYSVRRLNQLGYFQPIGEDQGAGNQEMVVDKTPDRENAVDITLNLEEQNRNQLTFGAGISQFEGFFGQISFQTANFLGRGESMTVALQAGDRAQNYQVGFSDPFLFDRNISGGFDVYRRQLRYPGYYTQNATGGNLVFGFPVADFSRMFLAYGYERVAMSDLSEAILDTSCLLRAEGCGVISSVEDLAEHFTPEQIAAFSQNPFLADSLLIGQGGRRSISKITPSFVHNTVDHPIFPTSGRRYTALVDLAVLGGNTHYYKPRLEGIWFLRHTSRTSIGLRAQTEYIAPLRGQASLPVFERLFLGGEYSVRGFDIRTIGPTVPGSVVVLGGNKSLLFNAEYLISIAGPVRLVLFFDAGQVRDIGQSFAWREDLTEMQFPDPPPLVDPFSGGGLVDPDAPGAVTTVVGQTSAFKTSTGIELRFFMPVLNVPFRLIYAFNPNRGGVLTSNLQPAPSRTFRFAVGTTF